MRAIDVADSMVARYGDELRITNMKLNKLLYYAQVEHIRADGAPLFEDEIEAWECGPVVPGVHRAFKGYGGGVIGAPTRDPGPIDADAARTVELVAGTYGRLSTFDLVEFSHRDGGAWRSVRDRAPGAAIGVRDIIASDDMRGVEGMGRTAREDISAVLESIPNALRLLANA